MKTRFLLWFFLVTLSFVVVRPPVYSQRHAAGGQYVEDQILVKFKSNAEPFGGSEGLADEVLQRPGARAESLSPTVPGGSHHLFHLNGRMSVEEAVRRANADPRVEYAEPDYILQASETVADDPFFTQMWGLSTLGCFFCGPDQPTANIDALRAWDITTGSNDVVAVVLDTGIDVAHEDLAENVWVNPHEIAGNGVDDDANGFVDDVNGWNFFDKTNQVFKSSGEDLHGTHVAGSIAAAGNNGKGVTGVAWRASLMSLKFLGGPKGKGSTGNAIRGINYAIDQRNRGVNVTVINASWGGPNESQSLRDAITAAGDAGILFVCSAGNEGVDMDQTPHFPSGFGGLPTCLSVAAMTSTDNLASFSNFGHGAVGVAAPGQSILSTAPRNQSSPNGAYTTLSGTSMSAPYVSGIAVLLWSHEPSLAPAQVKQRIVSTSEPIPALVSKAANSGRANAFSALTNRIAPPRSPIVLTASFTKKAVTLDGLGFLNGSAVIEVNGAALPTVAYDSSYALANGTLTRLTAKIGKKPMKAAFPSGLFVSVTVFNPTTGERSAQFVTVRF
ncbi:MAG TPA: S8 family peptidase [Blastocatellia bacterium]|nr:S8 family peptidase [Blastocatellia bacterium]